MHAWAVYQVAYVGGFLVGDAVRDCLLSGTEDINGTTAVGDAVGESLTHCDVMSSRLRGC